MRHLRDSFNRGNGILFTFYPVRFTNDDIPASVFERTRFSSLKISGYICRWPHGFFLLKGWKSVKNRVHCSVRGWASFHMRWGPLSRSTYSNGKTLAMLNSKSLIVRFTVCSWSVSSAICWFCRMMISFFLSISWRSCSRSSADWTGSGVYTSPVLLFELSFCLGRRPLLPLVGTISPVASSTRPRSFLWDLACFFSLSQ